MSLFKLTNMDLSGLQSMSNQRTCVRYDRYFNKIGHAIGFAEQEYGKQIDWVIEDHDNMRSPDLLHTMYYIKRIKTED